MIVGRHGQQPFQITDRSVSGKHCEITNLGNGTFAIQDLESTNGTFVNGIQIIKSQVSIKDKIVLGGSYQLDLAKCFNETVTPPPIGVFPSHLRKVYEDYTNQKHKIQSSQKWSMTLRIFVPQIFTFLAGLMLKGKDQDVNMAINAAGLAIGIIITIILTKFSDNSAKQLEDLTDNFKLNYVCGNTFGGKKCGQFLGFDSPKIWESRGCICPKCKKQIN